MNLNIGKTAGMRNRLLHKPGVCSFLQNHFPNRSWEFEIPKGSGNETYLAWNGEQRYFVKLGVQVKRYQTLASIGLAPPLLAAGSLDDGTSIIVQPHIAGRNPSRRDYHVHLEKFAAAIQRMHQCHDLKQLLPQVSTDFYNLIGLEALAHLRQKWEKYSPFVPQVSGFIEESLANLEERVTGFQGGGLVASHNDICNANWLIQPDGQIYLIDFEAMSLEDPAVDTGATLWWYYPPELRPRFLEIVGYADDREFENRMQVRMAMHCLNILLPREGSFDCFDADTFTGSLTDFRAALVGEENPQGYYDE